MIIGYARCSTAEQNLDWQIDELTRAHCERIYKEKASGAKSERTELRRMMDSLRNGDTVVICELTRLSRSTEDLFGFVNSLNDIGVNIKSLKESWLDTTSPQGKFLFTIMAGLSQFERDLIRQRTREGLAAARARGRKGGRPAKDRSTIELAVNMYNAKTIPISQILKQTGISKTTLYKYICKNNERGNNPVTDTISHSQSNSERASCTNRRAAETD